MNIFIETITSNDPSLRDRSFFGMSRGMDPSTLQKALRELDTFRKSTTSLYDKVRAIQFLYAGYRFFLLDSRETPSTGKIPYAGFDDLLARRFEQAIETFLHELDQHGPNANLFSALA